MANVELEVDADEHHAASSDTDFTLAHLSDLHLSSLAGVGLRALLGQRILGYVSGRSTGPTCSTRCVSMCRRSTSTISPSPATSRTSACRANFAKPRRGLRGS